jgi:hypothetical protein
MTLTPRATTDNIISAPTRRLILFPAAMSVYPFEPDDSYPISAGFAHYCARSERRCRRAANQRRIRAASIDGVAFWVLYQPTELQDTELAGISQRVYPGPFQNRCPLRRTSWVRLGLVAAASVRAENRGMSGMPRKRMQSESIIIFAKSISTLGSSPRAGLFATMPNARFRSPARCLGRHRYKA